MRPLRFNAADAQRAAETWGANCGPGAIAAVCGLTLDELRPRLFDFEQRGYTNPLLMFQILRGLGATWTSTVGQQRWPRWGLVRIQWHGPWMREGVPVRVRYRHTHWVGSSGLNHQFQIFDINAIHAGGWINFNAWSESLVPWILKHAEPKADGQWSITHSLEVLPPAAGAKP